MTKNWQPKKQTFYGLKCPSSGCTWKPKASTLAIAQGYWQQGGKCAQCPQSAASTPKQSKCDSSETLTQHGSSTSTKLPYPSTPCTARKKRGLQAALTAVDEEESPKTSALDMANAEINRLRALAATHHLKLKAIAKTISTIDSMEDVNEKCDAIRVLKNESCRWHVRDANKGHTSLAPMHEYFSAKASGGSGRDVAGAGENLVK